LEGAEDGELGLKKKMDEAAASALKSEVFQVDPEREIDRGLEKGIPPDSILRKIKGGWAPVDGKRSVIDKLGFIMFHDYFDDKSPFYEMHVVEFFDRWENFVCYVVPNDHVQNQQALLDIAHATFQTALRDDKTRAKQAYGFGTIIESLVNHNMVTKEAVRDWFEKVQDENDPTIKACAEAIEQTKEYLEGGNEVDSDSD